MSYVSIHNHTDFSNIRLLDCINKTEALIDYAHKIGLKGLAITDHDMLGAHVKALKHVDKRRAENPDDESWKNFQLILGNEIYLVRNKLSKTNFIAGQDKFYHLILLAKDEIGHRQIRELSSRAWKQSFYRFMERVPTYYSDLEEVLGADRGHVMASTACLGGFLGTMLLEAHKTKGKDFDAYSEYVNRLDTWLEWMTDLFGEGNLFLEKQPSLNKEQWIVNKAIEEISEKRNLPCVITTDTHYLTKADRFIHKAYLNAKEGDREVDEFYASTYLMTAKEIEEYFVAADKTFGVTSKMKRIEDIVARDLENTNTLVGAHIKSYALAHSPIIPRTKLSWEGTHTAFSVHYEWARV